MIFLRLARAQGLKAEDRNRLESAFEGLATKYTPLLAPARAAQAAVLNITEQDVTRSGQTSPSGLDDVVTFAEAYAVDDALIGVFTQISGRSRYRVGQSGVIEMAPIDQAPGDVTVFLMTPDPEDTKLVQLIEQVERETGMKLEPFHYSSGRFGELVEEGLQAPDEPSKKDRDAARLLADKDIRSLAIAIKSSAGLLLSDAGKQVPAESRDGVDGLIAALQASDLVTTEVVVICTRTSSQVARAENRAQIDRSARAGLTCACGRSLTDERIEEALTVSDRGRRLLDGSRWMSILLIDELLALGIPLDQMLLEQQANGDEVDCLAVISGELTFFELKDKEFNLGNAYSFGAKIGILRPEHRVIVTTEYVGGDAKEHFQRAVTADRRSPLGVERTPQQLLYIEGLDELEPKLRELVSAIYAKDAAELLEKVLPTATLDASSLVRAFSKREKAAPPVEQPRPARKRSGSKRVARPAS